MCVSVCVCVCVCVSVCFARLQLVLQPLLHNVFEGATARVDSGAFAERMDRGWAVFEKVSLSQSSLHTADYHRPV